MADDQIKQTSVSRSGDGHGGHGNLGAGNDDHQASQGGYGKDDGQGGSGGDDGHTGSGSGPGVNPLCFMQGTFIATPAGFMRVEDIQVGQEVCTAHGGVTRVRWIGRQTITVADADPLHSLPVRIQAGALGDHLPLRDLLLSPAHAILLDGVLAQAGALVNGQSIVRDDKVPETFIYYHIETPEHTLLLAEGVAAETFVDAAPRESFDNWDEFLALFPEGAGVAEMALPRVTSARQLPVSLSERLLARAVELSESATLAA